MRKGFLIIQLLLIMLLVALPDVGQATDKVRLTLVEYAPLMGEKMKGYGIEAAIVTAAFEEIGLNVEYAVLPVAGAYKSAKNGIYDGIVGFVWSEEREKSFYYSEPIFQAPLLLFHLKSYRFDWHAIDDLKGITIGVTAKNYYGPEFHKALEAGKLTVDEASKDAIQFDKLLRRRIKVFPMNRYTGYYMIQGKFSPEQAALFTHHPRPLKESVYHVLFSRAVKENGARVEKFNQGLRLIKESGKYDGIIEAYKMEYHLK